MATSQFTIYKSTDSGAPIFNGSTGSLVTVLSASLVAGYGSKPAAGWTMPYTSSNGYNAVFRNSTSGSGFYLNVFDDGRGGGSFSEARVNGFESASAWGTGSGQFPIPGTQGVLSNGYLVVRKSSSSGTVARVWILFADQYTFYFFAQTGDAIGVYYTFSFGDFYSLGGSGDIFRCRLTARTSENSSAGGSEKLDTSYGVQGGANDQFIPRTYGGGGVSIAASQHGDPSKCGMAGASTVFGNATAMQTPNAADNSYYVSPVWVTETAASSVRGRARGFWCLCHSYTNFADGQIFSGTNDVAGKSFMVVKTSTNTGCYLLETSATVETN